MRVHRSKEAQKAYERLKIEAIFNIPYSPQFNGIESVFSMLKEHYKRALMEKILSQIRFKAPTLIKEAI